MKPNDALGKKKCSEVIAAWVGAFFGLLSVLTALIICLILMNWAATPAHDQLGGKRLDYWTPPGSQQSFADPGRQLRRL